ncbi:hypothetical protein SKAU_G00127670 [Synaphobranchus kaupii]|uniref:Uncharacterized protein n=1 Tax=Synaphobranchus kaupii TaxID=118154 RepID=A0A9Q1J2N9_SYNKA|nr:hypothetical protein SKAU_G00127670 [Synaphobranchus kaupii]
MDFMAQYLHPLVASGNISPDLAEILMEWYYKKTTHRLLVTVQVITGEEFQLLFREREEKEQSTAALKEQRAQLQRRKLRQLPAPRLLHQSPCLHIHPPANSKR